MIGVFSSMASRRIGSDSHFGPTQTRRCRDWRGPAQNGPIFGPEGEVFGQPPGQGHLAAEVGLCLIEAARVFLEQAQAVAHLGQNLAMAGNGREFGHQLLEQVECRRKSFSAAAKSPISRLTQPRASTASARSLRTSACSASAVCPLQLGNGLIEDRLGLREMSVEAEQVGLAFEGLAQVKAVFGDSGRVFLGVGQQLLRRKRLFVKDIRLTGIGSAADQEVPQKRACSGQRQLHFVPAPVSPASGSSNSSERRYDRSESVSRPSLRMNVAHLLVGAAVL